ncbi:MAG: prefoldin subunit beta [archaeon]
MAMDESKIQEMQFLEQNLQNLMMQKQAFQMELTETESALREIESSGDEVFKIIGQLMIKTEKAKLKEELENKKKILDLRVKSIEKQESSLGEKLEEYREEIMRSVKGKK